MNPAESHREVRGLRSARNPERWPREPGGAAAPVRLRSPVISASILFGYAGPRVPSPGGERSGTGDRVPVHFGDEIDRAAAASAAEPCERPDFGPDRFLYPIDPR